mgnify:CR=1 FL=1
MDTTTIVLIVVAVIVILYLLSVYNRFVALKNNVSEAWSNIDVLLKQRHDEVPKLVDTCKIYMTYEADTLDKVIARRNEAEHAREKGDVAALGSAEGALNHAFSGLLARAEAYPDLKAAETFTHTMSRLSTLEDTIADRRELYNETVNINNTRRDQFPDFVVARLFGFSAADFLEIDSHERADVSMSALFAQ